MDLKDYLAMIGKRIWLFLAIVIIAIAGTYYYTVSQPNQYTGFITFYSLTTPQYKVTTDQSPYEYNNYYTMEASKDLTDLLISWFKDPAYVSNVYSKANENLPDVNLTKYSTLISTRKIVPGSFAVSITSEDEQYVKNILNASKDFVASNINKWTNEGIIKDVTAEPSDVIVAIQKPSLTVNLLIALVAGLAVAFVTVYFVEYFKKDK